ncbi:MAG: GerMN domain-containing protein, partial [Oscillospiraceae bacterium]|nr:GerMN domain-containing protein [Oscillospiraceae bacterium]
LRQEENGLKLYYCPEDLTQLSGGDALCYATVPWDTLPEGDRQERIQTALTLLMSDREGFESPIPAGTRLLGCTMVGGTVWVDFSEAYGQLSGMDLTTADYCVTLTLTQLEGVHVVRITVAGRELAYRDTNLLLAGDVLLTSTDDVVRSLAVQLYFPDGEGTLTAEDRLLNLYEGQSRAGVVVDALLAGPESDALLPLAPEGFAVVSVRLDDEMCYLNLSAESAALLPEDDAAQETVLLGLVRSLRSVEGVSAVQFLVDGEYSRTFGKVDISAPWTGE